MMNSIINTVVALRENRKEDSDRNEDERSEEEIMKGIELTKVLIEDCDFSVRAYNCLQHAGIKTLGDIKSVEQLHNVRNLGKRCANEVVDKLMEYGIELPESEGQDESNRG